MGGVLTVAWCVDQQTIGLAWGLHSGWVGAIATIESFDLISYHEHSPQWGIGFERRPLASIPGIVTLTIVGLGIGYFGSLN
ncbi:MAG: hypothetical protein F6K30_31025 [Cyanothece sp. SIO2G6]|nr:hypothetical protein [Cyanothece sp. SIO2G6]